MQEPLGQNAHIRNSLIEGAGSLCHGRTILPPTPAPVALPSREDFLARHRACLTALRGSLIETEFGINSVTDNTHLFSHVSICACLQALAESPELFPDQPRTPRLFLDLGCSTGRALLVVGAKGWRSYGVDLNDRCVEEARINISIAGARSFVDSRLVKVCTGNFFPATFDVERLENGAHDPRSDYLKSLATSAPSWEAASATLGITYHDVDFFYHYQVERLDNILRLFAQHARVGAILAVTFSFPENSPTIPDNVTRLGSCGPAGYSVEPIGIFLKSF